MNDSTAELEAIRKKESNEDRKRKGLLHRAERAHNWRVQVWAQSERRLRAINAQLETMGFPPFEPFEAYFEDDDALEHYATMSLDPS